MMTRRGRGKEKKPIQGKRRLLTGRRPSRQRNLTVGHAVSMINEHLDIAQRQLKMQSPSISTPEQMHELMHSTVELMEHRSHLHPDSGIGYTIAHWLVKRHILHTLHEKGYSREDLKTASGFLGEVYDNGPIRELEARISAARTLLQTETERAMHAEIAAEYDRLGNYAEKIGRTGCLCYERLIYATYPGLMRGLIKDLQEFIRSTEQIIQDHKTKGNHNQIFH